MAQHTVTANEIAIKALRCPEGKSRAVYGVDGFGNDGLKIYVERSGTKTWYYRARVAGSATKDMPLGRWPDVTIAEARKRKSAIVVSILDGEDPWRKRSRGAWSLCPAPHSMQCLANGLIPQPARNAHAIKTNCAMR